MDLKQKMQHYIHQMFVERGDPNLFLELVSDTCTAMTDRHAVFYFGNNMSVKDARELVAKVADLPQPIRVVAIVQGSVTSQASHMLNETDIQVLKSTCFHYSPIEHDYVPKHTLLSSSDKAQLLRVVPSHQLPKMLKDDVIAMFYGARVGDVFRIERPSGVYYRIVTGG